MDKINECEALDPRIKRAFSFEEHRGGQLEDEIERCFCWWRPGFRYQEPEEEVEHDAKSPQDGEEHTIIPGVAHESPLLETSLIALVDTLVERIEPTSIEPFVEGVPSLDEMPTIPEVFRVMIEFIGDRCPWKSH